MMQQTDFKTIFAEESERSGWKKQREPQALLRALGETMENTRVRAAGACFGSQLRTDACNALFRAAGVGIETAAAAALGVRVEQDAVKTPEKTPEVTLVVKEEKPADYLQPALLAAGFIACALTMNITLKKPLTLLSPIAALLLGVALVREVMEMKQSGALAGLVRIVLGKGLIARKVIAVLQLEPEKEKPQPAAKDAAKAEAKAAGETAQSARPVMDEKQIEKIDALCMKQMDLIAQNLPQEQQAPAQPDEERVLWPLVRTMLQKKYAEEMAFPADVEDELARYFRANGLSVYAYSEEHAALFKTQPMDETFTIFPAVVGQDGRIVEYGQACVKEE